MLLMKKAKKAVRFVLSVLSAAMLVLGVGTAAHAGLGTMATASVSGVDANATVVVNNPFTDPTKIFHITVTINGQVKDTITLDPNTSKSYPYTVPYQQTLTISSADGVSIFPGTSSYTNQTPPITGPIQAPHPGPATISADGTQFMVAAADHWTAAANGTVLTPGVWYPGTGTVVITYTAARGYADGGQASFTETIILGIATPPVYEQNELHVLICHATGTATNPYNPITISVAGVVSGHIHHGDDIWAAFDYVDVQTGKTVHVAAQGDQSILTAGCKVYVEPNPGPTQTETPAPTPTSTETATPAPTHSSTPSSIPSSSATSAAPVAGNSSAPAAVVQQQSDTSSEEQVVNAGNGQPSLKAATGVGEVSSSSPLSGILMALAGLALAVALVVPRRRGRHENA